MSRPLTQSDLTFPNASIPTLSSTLHSLKRSALSIHNRLSSISSDSAFVQAVSSAFNLPLVANERCGSWYIPLSEKAGSVYFKSTDGHTNEWGFSLRRLNLQLLDIVATKSGAVIVDSTRRGKSMPDALSKTVPVWCCVLNRAVFGEAENDLYTLPQAVSRSEHAEIERRIDGFVNQFLEICKPDIGYFQKKIRKPLRPIWITQESTLPEDPPSFADFYPVVLCTASRRVHGGEASENGYIQGAADDHEAWAYGLTPSIFWGNREQLLSTNEEELPNLIAKLITLNKASDAVPTLIKPTPNIYVSSSQNLVLDPFSVVISCTPEALTSNNKAHLEKRYLHLCCQQGKLGSRDLRVQLKHLQPFFETIPKNPGNILICCPSGRDLSVGVALAICCLYADDKGMISTQPTGKKVDKALIKQRLTWLTTSNPALNPPRGTLQSVNAMLMPNPSANKSMLHSNGIPSSHLTIIDEQGNLVADGTTKHSTVQ